jgi:hypothetical protein
MCTSRTFPPTVTLFCRLAPFWRRQNKVSPPGYIHEVHIYTRAFHQSGIFMNNLIIITPFTPVFDVLVYLYELIRGLSAFLCLEVNIQQLNFVNLCELPFLEVHGSTRGKGV